MQNDKSELSAKPADTPTATPVTPAAHTENSPTTTHANKKSHSKKPSANSRGPAPGKYQNGKVCFSAWLPTPFLVRLRRYATNLGFSGDIAALLQSDYANRIQSVRLSPDDLAEIELSNQSIRA